MLLHDYAANEDNTDLKGSIETTYQWYNQYKLPFKSLFQNQDVRISKVEDK